MCLFKKFELIRRDTCSIWRNFILSIGDKKVFIIVLKHYKTDFLKILHDEINYSNFGIYWKYFKLIPLNFIMLHTYNCQKNPVNVMYYVFNFYFCSFICILIHRKVTTNFTLHWAAIFFTYFYFLKRCFSLIWGNPLFCFLSTQNPPPLIFWYFFLFLMPILA